MENKWKGNGQKLDKSIDICNEIGYSLNMTEQGVMDMTIGEMQELRKQLGYSYEMVAQVSGVPLGTVQKVLLGITKCPRYDTIKALEEVFKPMYDSIVKETSAYNITASQDEFTVEDYLKLPEEERMELIDGVIYDLGAPTDKHQIIRDEIFARFRDYIRKKKGKCITITSPIDVQLDCDNRTMVQPDVVIVCDRNKFKKGRIFGAPDLVVEVLSNSTKKKDVFIKGNKYWNAGVREYWLVDPNKKVVHVYEYEKEDFQTIYTFEDKVPVGIWNNECEVDFAEIYEYISFLYEEDDVNSL